MAYFSRLIAAFLFLFISGHSFAACREGYQCQPALVNTFWAISAPTSCPSAGAQWAEKQTRSSTTYVVTGTPEKPSQCSFIYYTVSSGNPSPSSEAAVSMTFCPSGWSHYWDGSKNLCTQVRPPCASDETANPETGVCEKACPSAGSPAGSFTLSSKSIISVCNDGCQVVRDGDPAGFSYGGPMEWVTKFVYSGASCVPGEPPQTDGSDGTPDGGSADPTPPQDNDCYDKGLCPFNYNGKLLCTKCDSKEGKSNQSGSSSGTGTDSSGNPTGDTGTTSTTKETTANCTNGSCNTTTTTTVTNPDGSTTSTTETESTPQADFCKANPGHVVCKGEDEGTWGGSCAAGFQCSGDAVQCAQAEAAWKSACASDVSGMTEQINDGAAAMAAGAASGLGIPGGSDAFDLGSRLSEVPLFGSSGGCPSDVSVNVGGTSYTIAFSSMCPQLQVLGVALMAFAYLVAGFIVFRGDRS